MADEKLPDTDEPLDLSGVEQIPENEIDPEAGDLVIDGDPLGADEESAAQAEDEPLDADLAELDGALPQDLAANADGPAVEEDVPAAEDAGAEDDREPDEVIPFEFLQDPEAYSSVLPRYGLDRDDGGPRETVIMSPSEVRRLAARSGAARGLSSRRASASSSTGSSVGARRSKRVDEAELSPEELALRRRNDRFAKFVLYAALTVVCLVFLALLTYKAPFYVDWFPGGIWPWSEIFPEKYGG